MNKNEYENFIERYSRLNKVYEPPNIEKMIELQNTVFTNMPKGEIDKLWDERILSKIKRQKEFARLAAHTKSK